MVEVNSKVVESQLFPEKEPCNIRPVLCTLNNAIFSFRNGLGAGRRLAPLLAEEEMAISGGAPVYCVVFAGCMCSDAQVSGCLHDPVGGLMRS